MPVFSRKKRRVLVIGLDGVPHSLLTRLAADGTMPNVGRLLLLGHLSKMRVTLPEVSAVSWPSFMTGANPGTHGIFGFLDLKPGSYDVRFPGFRDLRVPTMWDRLGRRGKRCVVLNQPSTYPAREIPGVLVSGFVAIQLRKAVWPPAALPALEKMAYEIDIDTARARGDHDYLIGALASTLEGRRRAVDHFWKTEDWDYFQVVVTGTDRLHHYLWDALDDRAHAFHGAFLDYYRKVDAFVGGLAERFARDGGRTEEGEGLFLLSDHGFAGIVQEVRVASWLMEKGYLAFEKEPPDSLADITPSSRAFVLDPGRIYVNRKGRFPKGSVDDAGARVVMEEIKAGLAALSWNGRPVVERVFERDEIYAGPETPNAPDLVVVGHHGFDMKGTVREPEVFGRTNLTGAHTWDDAFFWSLRAAPPDLEITRLAGIIEDALP